MDDTLRPAVPAHLQAAEIAPETVMETVMEIATAVVEAATTVTVFEIGVTTAGTTIAMTAEMTAETVAAHVHHPVAIGLETAEMIVTVETTAGTTVVTIGTGVEVLRHAGQAQDVLQPHRPRTGTIV